MGDELLSDERRSAREKLQSMRPDEQIIAEQQRHSRAWGRAQAGLVAAAVIGCSTAFLMTRVPYLHDRPVTLNILFGLFFLLPLVAAFIAMWRVPPAPPEANEDRIVRKTADLHQARARWGMLAMIFMIFTQLPQILLMDTMGRNHAPSAVANAASALMVGVNSLLIVGTGAMMFLGPGFLRRKFLNDELTRAFKQRAVQLGYFLTLILFAGFGIAARFDAVRAAHLLPFGLGASVIIPTLYFIFLDWKASRA